MRVGLVAYLLHDGKSYRAAGVSTYIRQLLTHLPRVRPDLECLAFHGSDGTPPPGLTSAPSLLPTVNPSIRIVWEQLGLPFEAWTRQIDLVHGIVNVVPLLSPIPAVVTVHDLAFLRHPERFHHRRALYLRTAVTASVRRARHVIAVSASTRDDLVELLKLPGDSITVVHPGVDSGFAPLGVEAVHRFRRRIFDGRPFILHVGTLEPRKNLDVLIRAYAQLRQAEHVPHLLALVGSRGWMYDALFALVRDLHLESDVRFVDYVPPSDLPLWYNGADLFTYPSAYEGFGLPVAEAMACGVPVITSSSSSLAEVSGGACLMVETGSTGALQTAMSRVLHDSSLAAEMRRLGLARAARFDWNRTATETAAVYDRVWSETR